MSDSTATPAASLDDSSLYQEFLAQREEILRHKWFLSEEARMDVGFDAALIDWVLNHRAKWMSTRPQV